MGRRYAALFARLLTILMPMACAPAGAQDRGASREAFLAGQTINCPGCDLAGASLDRRDLTGADLSGADLRGATFSRAILRNANLAGANLAGAPLKRRDLTGANLAGANLEGATLHRAILRGANGRCHDVEFQDDPVVVDVSMAPTNESAQRKQRLPSTSSALLTWPPVAIFL